MTLLYNQFAHNMNKSLNSGIRYISLFLITSFLVAFSSGNAFSQVTVVGWDFDDSDNIADSGVPANSSKTTTSEGRTNYTYPSGASGQSISLTAWLPLLSAHLPRQ